MLGEMLGEISRGASKPGPVERAGWWGVESSRAGCPGRRFVMVAPPGRARVLVPRQATFASLLA